MPVVMHNPYEAGNFQTWKTMEVLEVLEVFGGFWGRFLVVSFGFKHQNEASELSKREKHI